MVTLLRVSNLTDIMADKHQKAYDNVVVALEDESDCPNNDTIKSTNSRVEASSVGGTIKPATECIQQVIDGLENRVRSVASVSNQDNLGKPLLSSNASQHSFREVLETGLDNQAQGTDDTPNGDLALGQSSPVDFTNTDSVSRRYAFTNNHQRSESIHQNTSSMSHRGSTIVFKDIDYVVSEKRFPWSKPVKKHVLCNISGMMFPGMNAIMGPTGSGKSSLLDVLAGRKDPKFLRGEVLVDGMQQPQNFKCISGYVVQDDIVTGTLSVRENLSFSAALRLPSTCTAADRKRKVNDVIEELGLSRVADSKIGTDLIRGVSGGERKRTNIGMELITDPSVLFLDEPTTGLDAYTAGSVLRTLKNMAIRGRTIIFAIHQPKYTIYKLFDRLTLVYNGRLIYHGMADRSPLDYFSSIGYVCEAHNNPPDFFMDIIHGEIPSQGNRVDITDVELGSELPTEVPEATGIGERLVEAYDASDMAKTVENTVAEIYRRSIVENGDFSSDKYLKSTKVEYPTKFPNQLVQVCWRTTLNLFRSPTSSVIQLGVYLFFAVSMGTVYLNMDKSLASGIQNRTGLFFFLNLQMTYVNIGAIEIFIKERPAFIHEISSGFYRVSAYFISKILCDVVPMRIMPVLLLMPIAYWMSGLRADAGAFFIFELDLILTTVAACGVAFVVSASFSVFGIANILVSIVYVFMMVFGGFLANIGTIPGWLNWCRYLSVFRYSMATLSINELTPLTFCGMKFNATTLNHTYQCTDGVDNLRQQGIRYGSAFDLWVNQIGLFCIGFVFYALSYVQLRRIRKYK